MADQTAAAKFRAAADLAETQWTPHPDGPGICSLLEAVAPLYVRPDRVDLWDLVVTHLNEEMTGHWERRPGRARTEVAALLRAAADLPA
ncbi:hypothetical protein GCM10010306_099130 [Streptomyces umbrinus]|uniref:hypothetical protein n=1 Tax=Streptomyces umbrinus TaxID=67370 RepID=UPI0016755BB2|nr:hypothetical protein [Streptomyces umbrinus]GHB88307.1 hypothetical protein GCM10010306_099130 [Streptomyces umbrinus]